MKRFNFTFFLTVMLYVLSGSLVFAVSVSGVVEAPGRIKGVVIFLKPSKDIKLNKSSGIQTVSQKDTQFNPPVTIIVTGDRILWKNDETKDIDHNIFSLSTLNRFDLGLGAKGSELTHTFKNTGVQNYYCSVHKRMDGKVVVLPSPHYQHLDKPGEFSIDHLPKGEWILDAVVFHRRYKAIPIRFKVDKEPIKNLSLKVVRQ